MDNKVVAFVGGGNMASALIGGLVKAGRPAASILVIEPFEAQRQKLAQQFGIAAQAQAGATLARASLVVWAVKPQLFREAAAPCAGLVGGALQLSVMAGVRSPALVAASGSPRVVRAMPNTPALIGRGIAGLWATAAVTPAERGDIDTLLAPTGATVWVDTEADLDAVTALSGSGPAYVFYLIEALMQAGVEMGLPEAQSRLLAERMIDGAAALATQSTLHPSELRAQVTSKGGTTHAAVVSLEADGVKAAFVKALKAAQARARELGEQL